MSINELKLRSRTFVPPHFYSVVSPMNAAPRPPPARPHVGINPPSHFSAYSATDWVEDDAWDSASDSESPVATTIARSSTSAVSVPKRPTGEKSNSTLAFSYTHLNAPSPSSYPPRPEQISTPTQRHEGKAGWTIVRTEQELRKSQEHSTAVAARTEADTELKGSSDVDVESDMVVGDLEQDMVPMPIRPRNGKETIRSDVDELVRGKWIFMHFTIHNQLFQDPLYSIRNPSRRKKARSPSPMRDVEDSGSASLRRERSIRTNRRRKFEECLLAQDVNIGAYLNTCSSVCSFRISRTSKTGVVRCPG